MASRSAIACSSTVPVVDLTQCGGGQVDGVFSVSVALLPVGVGDRLRLLFRELTQAAQQILRIATERKPEPAAAFHGAQRSSTL